MKEFMDPVKIQLGLINIMFRILDIWGAEGNAMERTQKILIPSLLLYG